MPRWQSVLNANIAAYQEYLRRRRRDGDTIAEYSRLIRQALDALGEAGLEVSPRRIGEEEISFVYTDLYSHLTPHTARLHLSIIGTWLKRMAHNPVVENMCLEWPEDLRINAKWLEPAQAKQLRNAAIGMERMVVHLELDCLMRRCEVLRLTVRDFRGGQIDVLGKGRLGGKRRSIPYHPKTPAELRYCMQLREAMAEAAQRRHGVAAVPDAVVVWERGGVLHAYQESGVDKMLKRAAERADLPQESVANHVLRRTGARIQWLAGTPIATIMRTLGHATEEQTIGYLGLNLNDMRAGMANAERYLEGLDVPESGTNAAKPDM
jgi:integrase